MGNRPLHLATHSCAALRFAVGFDTPPVAEKFVLCRFSLCTGVLFYHELRHAAFGEYFPSHRLQVGGGEGVDVPAQFRHVLQPSVVQGIPWQSRVQTVRASRRRCLSVRVSASWRHAVVFRRAVPSSCGRVRVAPDADTVARSSGPHPK